MAPSVPTQYPTMLSGQNRKREKKLDWWARFQTATGTGPAMARTATALAFTGGVLAMGAMTGHDRVVSFNGLARPVRVTVNGDSRLVRPGDKQSFRLRLISGMRLKHERSKTN